MDDSLLKKIIRLKFGKHRVLHSKAVGRFPKGIEREYAKLIRRYIDCFGKSYAKYRPVLDDLFEVFGEKGLTPGVVTYSQKIFYSMYNDFLRRSAGLKLENKVKALGIMGEKLSISEWKREVKRTIGIDILDDYYKGEFYRENLDLWVKDNVNLIKTRPQETLGKMMNIVNEGFTQGKTTDEIAKKISKAYDYDTYWAKFVARDQMAKLNAEITQRAQQDAGITRYEWSTSDDSRVRKGHAALDGKIFSWDDPPIVDPATGRRCHPGQDFQCRCVALPVFDENTLKFNAGYVKKEGRKND